MCVCVGPSVHMIVSVICLFFVSICVHTVVVLCYQVASAITCRCPARVGIKQASIICTIRREHNLYTVA